jgi:hypothetical protein
VSIHIEAGPQAQLHASLQDRAGLWWWTGRRGERLFSVAAVWGYSRELALDPGSVFLIDPPHLRGGVSPWVSTPARKDQSGLLESLQQAFQTAGTALDPRAQRPLRHPPLPTGWLLLGGAGLQDYAASAAAAYRTTV